MLGFQSGRTKNILLQFLQFVDRFAPMDEATKNTIVEKELPGTNAEKKIFITPNPSGSDLMYEDASMVESRERPGAAIRDKNLVTYPFDPIAAKIDVGSSRFFNILAPNFSKCVFFLTQEYEDENKPGETVSKNLFKLGSLNELMEVLGTFAPVTQFSSEILPQVIIDMCSGEVTLENLQFIMFANDLPCLTMDVNYGFQIGNSFATALGIKSIGSSIKLTFGETHCAIDVSMSLTLSIGIKLVGKRTNEMFIVSYEPDGQPPVTLGHLANGMTGLKSVMKSGVEGLADDSCNVKDLTLVFQNHSFDSLMMSVQSTFEGDVGKVQYSEPYAFLDIKDPLGKFRTIDLGLGFNLSIGSLKNIKVIGILQHIKNEGLKGRLYATIVGTVKVKDVFDLEDNDLTIEIPNMLPANKLDVAELGIKNPQFAFVYDEKPAIEVGWDGMSIVVGGTSKLEVHLTIPTGIEELTKVHLKYLKDDGDGESVKRLETEFSLQGEDNFVADGIKLLGRVGESIVEKNTDPIILAIEKSDKEFRLYMPKNLIPPTVNFGGENGLTLRDTSCFLERGGNKMNFGVEGSLTVNMLGKPIVFTGGLSVLPPRGFEGTLSVDGDFQIGAHVIVKQFGFNLVLGAVSSAGGESQFLLYDKYGMLSIELGITPAMVPFPKQFTLLYPGELTVIGLIEAFLGESNFTELVPDEIGKLVRIYGLPKEGGDGEIIISFDILEVEFEIDCHINILDVFVGSLKGGFSLLKGIDFTAELKKVELPSAELPLLKIGGYNEGEDAKLVLIVPGPASSKEFKVLVSCSVTLLGLTRATEILINKEEMSFKVEGDMFGVLSAKLFVAGSIKDTKNLQIDAVFENKIIQTITESSSAAVDTLCDGAAKGIESAQQYLKKLERELDDLKSQRGALITKITKEREAALKKLRDAKNAVEYRRKEVSKYEALIDREREVVRKERQKIKNKLTAARRSLKENEQSEKRIQIEINQRRKELQKKKKDIEDEIKRVQRKIDDWNRSIASWQNSINWHNREIGNWKRKISSKRGEINRLSRWHFYKKPGMYGQITYYHGRISALTVARVAIEGSKRAAEGTLRGIRGTLSYANRRLKDIPTELVDPKFLSLVAKREAVVLAKKAAILILNGAEGVLDLAPIDVDPRVARYIVTKEAKDAALVIARESVALLEDAMSDLFDLIDVEKDPRVLLFDGSIAVAKELVDFAQVGLDTLYDGIQGGMRDALKFMAKGVNAVVNAIPFVITKIEFSTSLGETGGDIMLLVEYNFCKREHSIEFGFNFQNAGQVLVEFSKEIARICLGLKKSGSNSRSLDGMEVNDDDDDDEGYLTLEEIEAIEGQMNDIEKSIEREIKDNMLEYQNSQTELKKELLDAQVASANLRHELNEEHGITCDQDNEIIDEAKKLLGQYKKAQEPKASSKSRSLSDGSEERFNELEIALNNVEEGLKQFKDLTLSAKEQTEKSLSALKEASNKIHEEDRIEEEEHAREMSNRRSRGVFSAHEERALDRAFKQRKIDRWEANEKDLRKKVMEDRTKEQEVLGQKAALIGGLNHTVKLLSDVSDAFEADVNLLTSKAAQKREFDASAEFAAEEVHDGTMHYIPDDEADEKNESDEVAFERLDDTERALLNMTLFQHHVAECAISAQRKAAYDLALARILHVEDGITETLDKLRDDGKEPVIIKRPTVKVSKPEATKVQASEISADFRMISGCKDKQTSSDVQDIAAFRLPDPAGRSGGACTSALLKVLYSDQSKTMSFKNLLINLRGALEEEKYTQIPQLSTSHEIDINSNFDLVPENFTGTKRAVLVGINYVGQTNELSGCHNDIFNMKKYLINVHGFEEENIVELIDDGEHDVPTKANILGAFRKIVQDSKSGDCLFCHFAGHGGTVTDDSGDEIDGYDETIFPVDWKSAGCILDDELFNVLVIPMREGVTSTFLMDCCHSGTVMDLPYTFRPEDETEAMDES